MRGSKGQFEIILDPQLYVPSTQRGKLKKWDYFPKDVDSADLTSAQWWTDLNKKLATAATRIKANAVCSPIVIPKVFDDRYYAASVRVCNELIERLTGKSLAVLQTILVNLAELSDANRVSQIASVVSQTNADRGYLIFVGSTIPRRELTAVDELVGAMGFIRALQDSELRVIVGFCSSDVLLWKHAGAADCASGKFFNLRRFTRQRFEEPTAEGGGQLPYWFEEGLLAFLREGDVLRVRKRDLLSEASKANPFCLEVLALLDEAQRNHSEMQAWLRLSWRQFLYWFADAEAKLANKDVSCSDLLESADANWKALDKAKIFMEERDNDGTWVRSWMNAVTEFESQSQ